MQKKRPPAVTVIAVLNLVFGSLGVVVGLCGGVVLLGAVLLLNQPSVAKDKAIQELKTVFTSMAEQIPGLVPFTIGSMILSLILAVVLVVAGIGLLKMRNWARLLSIAYAVIEILLTIGTMIFQIMYLNPAMTRWQQDFVAKHGGPGAAQMGGNPFGSALGGTIGGIVGTVINIAYAVAVLIVMFLPAVVAAFHAAPTSDLLPPPDEEDYYDRGGGWSAPSEPPPAGPPSY